MRSVAELIARAVAAAPPLTDEQRARLTVLLSPPTKAVRRPDAGETQRVAA
ncbi:hypothetical protein ACQEVZ_38715 [Dactylosporangium sp. CA-152071]|uniref:hypothetical protein n=1 Tax=Dactylosporangium sp. CA-152071 TaxID=3239933 RepID=UPI003D8CDAA4